MIVSHRIIRDRYDTASRFKPDGSIVLDLTLNRLTDSKLSCAIHRPL